MWLLEKMDISYIVRSAELQTNYRKFSHLREIFRTRLLRAIKLSSKINFINQKSDRQIFKLNLLEGVNLILRRIYQKSRNL